MLDLSQGDRLTFSVITALVLQVNLWEMVSRSTPLNIAVLLILLGFSIFSWTIIFAKWSTFGRARRADTRFLRAFRKANALDAVMVASEELSKLERNMGWLATTASVSPFIGLFGTVLGIIRSFQELGQQGSSSLRAVGPGISEALIATAVGLAAAIPAAIFYNHFGNIIKEMGARMDDFSLEFLNLTERSYGE